MTLDDIVAPFRETKALIEKSYRELFIDFAKIYLLTFLVGAVAGGAVFAFLLALGIGASVADLLANPPLLAVAAVVGALAIIVIGIISSAISTTMYPMVKARDKGKGVDIIKTATELLPPIARYLLVMWGISILIFLPGVIVLGLALFVESLGLLALLAPLFMVLSLAAYILFTFLVQFAIIEVALNGAGAVKSLKASMKKVKKNWLVVLGFDIMVLLAGMVLGIVSSLVQQIVGFLLLLAVVNIFFVAIVFLLYVAIMLVTSIATAMVTVPAFYYFWRSLK